MKYLLPLLVAAGLAITGCGGGNNDNCAVLQNGNKLCGKAFASWCQLTDPQRQQALDAAAADPLAVDPNTYAQLQSAQQECADVESRGH